MVGNKGTGLCSEPLKITGSLDRAFQPALLKFQTLACLASHRLRVFLRIRRDRATYKSRNHESQFCVCEYFRHDPKVKSKPFSLFQSFNLVIVDNRGSGNNCCRTLQASSVVRLDPMAQPFC